MQKLAKNGKQDKKQLATGYDQASFILLFVTLTIFGETFYCVYQSIKHGIYYCFLAGPSEQDLDGEDERSEGNPWRAVCSALVFSCTILWLFLIHILCVEGLIYCLILSMSFLCLWDSQIFLRIVAMQIIASTHLR